MNYETAKRYGCRKDEVERNECGFTLIEVLIALAIFSIGILGVAQMQISAIKGNAKAMELEEKINLASSQIERLMNLPYEDIADGSFNLQNSDYFLTWTVQTHDDDVAIPETTKKIVMTVTPTTARMGKKVSLSLVQLIAEVEE